MSGRYTPQLQATITRLGGRMPFSEAAQEVWHSCGTTVTASTMRRTSQRHGRAAEAVAKEEVVRLETEAPTATARPKQLLVSVDGALIPLTNGEWREVKSVAIGSFETKWQRKKGALEVKTGELTYFSRSYRIRDFERFALAEFHRRGVDNARQVVAVNDGAEWIQPFLDYHCPEATRIIDFSHAASYLADAGKAIYGSETESFRRWFQHARRELKRKPPQQTLANLALLRPKADAEEQRAAVDCAYRYFEKRLAMLDYPHFQRCGLPIGSGAVESSHKHVIHCRLKGAGMRWAPASVDPMLALRNLLSNKRWQEGWQDIVAHHQKQRRLKLHQRVAAKQPPPKEPLTFASLAAAGLLPAPPPAEPPDAKLAKRWRPAPDHPWRNGHWPTKVAWRWN